MRVDLEFHPPMQGRVDASSLQPDFILRMTRVEMEHLTLTISNQIIPLAEACTILCDPEGVDDLVLSGETQILTKVGHSMKGGKLTVEGDAGDEVGVDMTSGLIRVHGSVGDWCGANKTANSSGMQGGMIFVDGRAGDQVGAGMRRGLIYISKNTGQYTGARMAAGTILCGGKLGDNPGLGMKRGSIIASKIDCLLPGFYPAGKADDEWLKVCFSEVRRAGMSLPAKWLKAIPMRFTGDHLEMGKGEILVYEPLE